MDEPPSQIKMETPIKCGSVKLKRSNLLENRLLIGIDSGSSMTKVLFLHKDNAIQLTDKSTEFVTLTHGLFNNADFESAMKWTAQHAYVPEDCLYSVHITGTGACNKIEVIESVLGLKTEYVDEMLTIAAGHRIALEEIGLAQLISAAVETQDDGKIESEMFEKFLAGLSSKFNVEDKKDSIFPCLIHVYGSASGFFYFDENGIGEFTSMLLAGGRSFLGLAKCLLDTNNFDEVMQLASTGNRSNVDTQAKEMLSDDPNSPYGKFPPELPVFPFGKCMDLNIGREHIKKEDLASSLAAYFGYVMVMNCTHLCMLKKIPKVYLTGNIFRSNLFKKEITRMLAIFPFMLNFEILDFGYFGALGTMFSSNKDKEKYYKSGSSF